jgi:hypothetical protein
MIVLLVLCWIFSGVLTALIDGFVRDLIRAETTELKIRCIDSITICVMLLFASILSVITIMVFFT